MTDVVLALAAKLAALTVDSPSPSASAISSRATDDNIVRPGWLGFAVFLAMAGATALLLRSFVKQVKRINFDEDATEQKPTNGGDVSPHPDGEAV